MIPPSITRCPVQAPHMVKFSSNANKHQCADNLDYYRSNQGGLLDDAHKDEITCTCHQLVPSATYCYHHTPKSCSVHFDYALLSDVLVRYTCVRFCHQLRSDTSTDFVSWAAMKHWQQNSLAFISRRFARLPRSSPVGL